MQPTQRPNVNPVMEAGLELANNSWKLAVTDGRRPNPAVLTLTVADLWDRLEDLAQRLGDLKRRWGLPGDCQGILCQPNLILFVQGGRD